MWKAGMPLLRHLSTTLSSRVSLSTVVLGGGPVLGGGVAGVDGSKYMLIT